MKSTVVHEVSEGQHRIVVLQEDGSNEAGQWTDASNVAVNGKYFSITGESALPQGVFTVKSVPHQVLT